MNGPEMRANKLLVIQWRSGMTAERKRSDRSDAKRVPEEKCSKCNYPGFESAARCNRSLKLRGKLDDLHEL